MPEFEVVQNQEPVEEQEIKEIKVHYSHDIQNFMYATGFRLPSAVKTGAPGYINYIGCSEENPRQWSFLDGNRIKRVQESIATDNELSPWSTTIRIRSNVGRVVRKLHLCAYGKELPADEIAKLVRVWDKHTGNTDMYQFEMLKGEEIRDAYYHDNYVSERGNLGSSCMRYVSCQGYFDVYVRNPDKIKLAVLKEEGKVAARCLVWDGKYYDRIYAIDNLTEDTLREKCKKQGLVNCYAGEAGDIEITIKHFDFEHWPYLDSFCYLVNDESGTLCNFEPSGSYYYLQSTDGEAYFSNVKCSNCGRRIRNSDDAYMIGDEPYCGDCVRYDTVSGEYILEDEAVFIERTGQYTSEDNVTQIYTGEYELTDNVVELHDGEYAFKNDSDLVELHDGEYAISGRDDISEITLGEHRGEWALDEDLEEISGMCLKGEIDHD
jgi:hypothetical protein